MLDCSGECGAVHLRHSHIDQHQIDQAACLRAFRERPDLPPRLKPCSRELLKRGDRQFADITIIINNYRYRGGIGTERCVTVAFRALVFRSGTGSRKIDRDCRSTAQFCLSMRTPPLDCFAMP